MSSTIKLLTWPDDLSAPAVRAGRARAQRPRRAGPLRGRVRNARSPGLGGDGLRGEGDDPGCGDRAVEPVRVGRIAERGEAELPAPAVPGQPANLGDALAALQSVSEGRRSAARRTARRLVLSRVRAARTAVRSGNPVRSLPGSDTSGVATRSRPGPLGRDQGSSPCPLCGSSNRQRHSLPSPVGSSRHARSCPFDVGLVRCVKFRFATTAPVSRRWIRHRCRWDNAATTRGAVQVASDNPVELATAYQFPRTSSMRSRVPRAP